MSAWSWRSQSFRWHQTPPWVGGTARTGSPGGRWLQRRYSDPWLSLYVVSSFILLSPWNFDFKCKVKGPFILSSSVKWHDQFWVPFLDLVIIPLFLDTCSKTFSLSPSVAGLLLGSCCPSCEPWSLGPAQGISRWTTPTCPSCLSWCLLRPETFPKPKLGPLVTRLKGLFTFPLQCGLGLRRWCCVQKRSRLHWRRSRAGAAVTLCSPLHPSAWRSAGAQDR